MNHCVFLISMNTSQIVINYQVPPFILSFAS